MAQLSSFFWCSRGQGQASKKNIEIVCRKVVQKNQRMQYVVPFGCSSTQLKQKCLKVQLPEMLIFACLSFFVPQTKNKQLFLLTKRKCLGHVMIQTRWAIKQAKLALYCISMTGTDWKKKLKGYLSEANMGKMQSTKTQRLRFCTTTNPTAET